MAETIKKAAAKTKDAADALSKAVGAARTRSGDPKIVQPEPAPAPATPAPRDPVPLLDAFIAQETHLMQAVDFPDDTGDAMFNAVTAYLYYRERISKAELVRKHLKEG